MADWAVTSDEKRCFSYFLHRSVPSLTTFFDSPLWEEHIFQIAHLDHAVYHATIMLGALHEDSDKNKMRLSGEDLAHPRHYFALEQASRAFALLNRRQALHDPLLQEVTLMCCLLFVISDLLLGQYDRASQHLRGGLQILGEAKQQRRPQAMNGALVQIFQRLDVEFSHFGPGKPFLFKEDEKEIWVDRKVVLCNLRDVHQEVTRLMNITNPFIAQCWPLSKTEIEAEYENLHRKQQRLLHLHDQLQSQIQTLYDQCRHSLTYRERRGMDLSLLECQGQALGLKTYLMKGPVPADITTDCLAILSRYDFIMAEYSERPTITLDYGVIPSLHVVASGCPDYKVRLRAINGLLAWPHHEGVANSNISASLALEKLKVELQTNKQEKLALIEKSAEEELNQFLLKTLQATQYGANWTSIRAFNIPISV